MQRKKPTRRPPPRTINGPPPEPASSLPDGPPDIVQSSHRSQRKRELRDQLLVTVFSAAVALVCWLFVLGYPASIGVYADPVCRIIVCCWVVHLVKIYLPKPARYINWFAVIATLAALLVFYWVSN